MLAYTDAFVCSTRFLPSDRFADGDEEGGDAALRAADTAKKHHCTTDALLDAMETAEASYEHGHASAGAA